MRDGERSEVVSLPRGDEAVWGPNAPFVPVGSDKIQFIPNMRIGHTKEGCDTPERRSSIPKYNGRSYVSANGSMYSPIVPFSQHFFL